MLAFLVHCNQLTWSELQQQTTGGRKRHKKHHDMDVEALPTAAQQRLATHMENHGSEPPEKMFRLRYGGKERVWGVRVRVKWHMICADPEHRVYPTDPNP